MIRGRIVGSVDENNFDTSATIAKRWVSLMNNFTRNNPQMSKTWHYKLVLLGDTAVGKSCLVVRFVRDEFFEFQEPTIGAAFLTQTVTLDETTVKFEIWDTAGQGKFHIVLFSNCVNI